MKLNIKQTLLVGTALVTVGFSTPAQAATELDGTSITATDATGVTETNATTAVTIDSTGGAITLGANGTPSVVMNSNSNTLTLAVTTSGAANGVVFADNITETSGNIVINVTNDNATFQGTVGAIDLNAGSGGADPTILLTVRVANAENISFAGTIDAVDAGDTVNLAIDNAAGGTRTIAFSDDIGGSIALDAITVGGNNLAGNISLTFSGDVHADSITMGVLGGAVQANSVTFGTPGTTAETSADIIVSDNAADTNSLDARGTFTFRGTVGSAANIIDNINMGIDDHANITFEEDVYANIIDAGENGTYNKTVNFGRAGESITVGINNIGPSIPHDNFVVTVVGGATALFTGNITSNVDGITIGADGEDTTATFQGDIAAVPMTIGAGAGTADTNIVNIGSTAAAISLDGTITGGHTADNNTLNFIGTQAITASAVIGAGGTLDAITMGSANETLTVTLQNNVTTGTLTIGAAGVSNTHVLNLGQSGQTRTFTGDIAIASNADDTNTLNALGTYSFDGTIGSAAQLVDTINSGGAAAASTVTFTDDTYASTLNIGGTAGGAHAHTTRFGESGQTVTIGIASIVGTDAGDTNDITVIGGSTTTFTGNIGSNIDTITIGADGTNTAATFQGTLASGTITIGAGAGTSDTNALTVGSSTADITLVGDIAGGVAGDHNTLNITGGRIVTTANNIMTNMDVIAVGTNTTFSTSGWLAATDISLASGSTLLSTGNNNFTANINGPGTLDVNNALTIAGSVGGTTALSSLTIAEGITVIIHGVTGSRTLDADTILLEDNDGGGADDSSNSTLTLFPGANTITVKSAITSGDDNTSVLQIGNGTGTVAFEDDIGTSTVKLRSFTSLGGSNNIITTLGDMYINTINLDDADTLHFLGTGAQTVSGNIRGAGATDGAVVVGNGTTANPTVTFGTIGSGATLGTFDVLEGATAILSGDATTATDFTIDGTLRINQGVTAMSADIGAGAGTAGTIEFVVGTNLGVGNAGILALTNADQNDFVGGSRLVIPSIVIGTGVIENNSKFLIIQDTDGTIANSSAALSEIVTDDSALLDFTLVRGDTVGDADDTFWVVASTLASDSVIVSGNNAAAVTSLLSIESASESRLLAIISNVQNASSSEIEEMSESIVPTVDNSVIVTALNISDISLDLNNTRLANLRTGNETGLSAGASAQGLHWWSQTFGQIIDQGRHDNVDGYGADTYGLAAGIDSESIHDDAVIGMAVSYARSDISSRNANRTETDIDSYQMSAYADYDFFESSWVSAMVSYSWNEVNSTRHNVGGVSGLSARGNHSAQQYNARAKIGRDYAFRDMTISPNIITHWVHYSPDSYTETGAGGANLRIDGKDVDIFDLGLEADIYWTADLKNGAKIHPSIHAGYRYDVIGDAIQATSNFTGGGAAFTTEGADPARSKFNIGTGISYAATNNWKVTANYDFEYREDYDAHAGYLRAGYKF